MSDKDLEFIQQAGSVISGSIDSKKGTSNLPTDVLIQELKNIRGMFVLQGAGTANVFGTNAGTNETRPAEDATQEEITAWRIDGLLIDFE